VSGDGQFFNTVFQQNLRAPLGLPSNGAVRGPLGYKEALIGELCGRPVKMRLRFQREDRPGAPPANKALNKPDWPERGRRSTPGPAPRILLKKKLNGSLRCRAF